MGNEGGGFTFLMAVIVYPAHRSGVRGISSGILRVLIMLWAEKKIRKVFSKFRPFLSHIKSNSLLKTGARWGAFWKGRLTEMAVTFLWLVKKFWKLFHSKALYLSFQMSPTTAKSVHGARRDTQNKVKPPPRYPYFNIHVHIISINQSPAESRKRKWILN